MARVYRTLNILIKIILHITRFSVPPLILLWIIQHVDKTSLVEKFICLLCIHESVTQPKYSADISMINVDILKICSRFICLLVAYLILKR